MSNSHKSERLSRTAARMAAKDADDLEAAALRAGASVKVALDESVYDQEISEEEIEGEAVNEDQDPMKEVTDKDTATEQLVTSAVSVVHERQNLLGEVYPFRVSATGLEYVGSHTLVYELCLAIGNVNVSESPYKRLQIAFERLAGAAMAIVLGRGAEFLRTGYPPDSVPEVTGEPVSFVDAVAILNERMPDEWVADPNTRYADPKDGGMDAVVWKRMDKRTGSLVYVANCGCGSNWFKDKKHRERPSEQLGQLLSRPKPYHINDFFCVPFHINERRDWEEACDQGRFVLDRVRLTLAAEKVGNEWAARGQTVEAIRDLIQMADASFKPKAREGPM